jgi:threonine dehydrogenase-like Zn-dependent dehydrogenase
LRAVHFPEPGRAVIVDVPRPHVVAPDDAVVMVTTAGLTQWDVARCEDPSAGAQGLGTRAHDAHPTVPGGEFAGNIVELGPAVTAFQINDLVFALSGWREPDGRARMFGQAGLDGGHAEYVRVPHAGRLLVKTTAAVEERSLLAGGTLGLGAGAAEIARERHQGGRLIVAGCDPLGIAALASLHKSGSFAEVIALDFRPARLAVAKRYGARPVNVREAGAANSAGPADVVIAGALSDRPGTAWIAGAVRPGGAIVFTEPDGLEKWAALDVPVREGVQLMAAQWPSQEQASKLAMLLQVKKMDLAQVVSHVVPLELAGEAYREAVMRGPAVQKVLLKP